ncbi:MAG: HAMP domain-containing protein, partial [Elusimicrobia bacterium]|nr:HAMP domain-containing protein [Elusimicrobiota bacterium]
MGWLRSGLSRRFAAVMGALALVPVLFLSWRMMQTSRRGVQDAVLELHVKLAEKTSERVEGWVDSVDGRVQVALLALQSRMDWPEKQSLLKHLVESGSGISSVTLLRRDAGGAILMVFNPDLSDPVTSEDLRRARAAMRAGPNLGGRIAEVLRGPKGARLIVYYAFSKDVFARVAIPLSLIAERVAEERVGGTGFGVLVGADGAALATPEGRELSGLHDWAITRAALTGSTAGSSEFSDGHGKVYVGAYAPAPSVGGAVLILQARDEAYLAASEARRAAVAAVFVVILGSLLAAALLARALTAPVLKLTQAAEAVARGDFETRVEISTNDELQKLAETFNAMTARLRQYSVLQVDRLIAEQRKTEAILFSIREGIVMTDREGRVQLVNRRAREMFDLSQETELEGEPLSGAFPAGPLLTALLASGEKPGE